VIQNYPQPNLAPLMKRGFAAKKMGQYSLKAAKIFVNAINISEGEESMK
jgi:hypothetical protein